MTLFLKCLQMSHHPVKRHPLPYLYANVKLSSLEEGENTEKSNAIPPNWNLNQFRFDISNVGADEKLRITIYESRLFMVEEALGFCEILISSLVQNQLLIEWANITPVRQRLPLMEILLMIHITTNQADEENPFIAPQAELLTSVPWNAKEIESKYLQQTPLGASQGEEEIEIGNEESPFRSAMAPVLNFFSSV